VEKIWIDGTHENSKYCIMFMHSTNVAKLLIRRGTCHHLVYWQRVVVVVAYCFLTRE